MTETTLPFAEKWLQLKTQLSRPPGQLAAILLALYVLAVISGHQLFIDELLKVVGLVGGFGLVYLGLQKWQPTRSFPWVNTIITLSLLLLILEPTAQWWQMAILGSALAAAKRWLRWRQLPVVNYTVLMMCLGYLIGVFPFWWGVSFSPRLTSMEISWATFVMVPVGLYFANKYHKLPTIAAMLAVFGVVEYVLTQAFPLYLLVEGTLLFFATIMVVEPKTSPTVQTEQVVFGASVGALLAVGLIQYWPYPYETALLSGNLGYVVWKWWRARKMMASQAVAIAQ